MTYHLSGLGLDLSAATSAAVTGATRTGSTTTSTSTSSAAKQASTAVTAVTGGGSSKMGAGVATSPSVMDILAQQQGSQAPENPFASMFANQNSMVSGDDPMIRNMLIGGAILSGVILLTVLTRRPRVTAPAMALARAAAPATAVTPMAVTPNRHRRGRR